MQVDKPQLMKAKLYRIILPVTDMDKAERFYSHALAQPGNRVSPGRHYFDVGGTILACYNAAADGHRPGEWRFHENQYVYFSVPDLEAARDRMEKLDCRFLGKIEAMPWGETLFYANDPFGNPICFVDEQTVFRG